MGGTLDSVEMGCDVVGGGEGGAAKVISSMGVERAVDALGSVLSGSMWPFPLVVGSLISEAAIPFCVFDGGATVSVVAVSWMTSRFGSGGGSLASTREVRNSA